MRIATTAHVASHAWIFLPRYSGVRPTISPAMNTVSSTCIRMPYSPAPTPPNTMQPSMRFHSGARPASGVKLSCIELTAPQEVPVVATAQSTLFITPNRCLLAFEQRLHVADDGIGSRLGPPRQREAAQQQRQHHAKQTPSVPPIADQQAERINQRGRDDDQAEHLDEIA